MEGNIKTNPGDEVEDSKQLLQDMVHTRENFSEHSAVF
jgi:hypothetical protein